jgi:hypothetical protein
MSDLRLRNPSARHLIAPSPGVPGWNSVIWELGFERQKAEIGRRKGNCLPKAKAERLRAKGRRQKACRCSGRCSHRPIGHAGAGGKRPQRSASPRASRAATAWPIARCRRHPAVVLLKLVLSVTLVP